MREAAGNEISGWTVRLVKVFRCRPREIGAAAHHPRRVPQSVGQRRKPLYSRLPPESGGLVQQAIQVQAGKLFLLWHQCEPSPTTARTHQTIAQSALSFGIADICFKIVPIVLALAAHDQSRNVIGMRLIHQRLLGDQTKLGCILEQSASEGQAIQGLRILAISYGFEHIRRPCSIGFCRTAAHVGPRNNSSAGWARFAGVSLRADLGENRKVWGNRTRSLHGTLRAKFARWHPASKPSSEASMIARLPHTWRYSPTRVSGGPQSRRRVPVASAGRWFLRSSSSESGGLGSHWPAGVGTESVL